MATGSLDWIGLPGQRTAVVVPGSAEFSLEVECTNVQKFWSEADEFAVGDRRWVPVPDRDGPCCDWFLLARVPCCVSAAVLPGTEDPDAVLAGIQFVDRGVWADAIVPGALEQDEAAGLDHVGLQGIAVDLNLYDPGVQYWLTGEIDACPFRVQVAPGSVPDPVCSNEAENVDLATELTFVDLSTDEWTALVVAALP